MGAEDKLTERQRRFAKRYAETGNGAQSARDVGYSDAPGAAATNAHRTLLNVDVQQAIQAQSESLLERAGFNADTVVSSHVNRAQWDQEEGRAPHPVSKAAADTLLRMAGVLEPEKGEQHAHLHLSGLTREQLEALEARLESREQPPAD